MTQANGGGRYIVVWVLWLLIAVYLGAAGHTAPGGRPLPGSYSSD